MKTYLFLALLILATGTATCLAQSMPATSGETLTGKHLAPAEAVRGHAAILIASFSHNAGMHGAAWMKAIEGDPALKDVKVLELAMLGKAPAMVRGIIKSGMRKNAPAAEQDHIVVMTEDQAQWEEFFGVGDDREPYVLVLDTKGDLIWHGHGQAVELEPELRKTLTR